MGLYCDGDMYASTMECLQSAGRLVNKGGWIFSDDYYAFRGSYLATREYFMNAVNVSDMFLACSTNVDVINEITGSCTPPESNAWPPTLGECSNSYGYRR